MHRRDLADGGDHRDRCLAATGHHVDVPGVEIGFTIDRGDGVGADRGGGEVDDLLAVLAQRFVMHLVGVGRGCVEHDADLGVNVHLHEAFKPLMGGGDAALARHGEPFGRLVDADHGHQLHILRIFDHLDHEVGADIARPDDRRLDLARHQILLTASRASDTLFINLQIKRAVQLPTPWSCISNTSPACAGSSGTRLPDNITSPASSVTP